MPGYDIKIESLNLPGAADLIVRSLKDNQQYSDPEGLAEAAGVSSAMWPIFGLIWPSGRILAEHVATMEIGARRVLELGCGLGLATLVLQRLGADITASDIHPLAEVFLAKNMELNQLEAVSFHTGAWCNAAPDLGLFDLFVGSDVLYDPEHAGDLSAFIERHAAVAAEVVIVDPNRGHRAGFRRLMAGFGFDVTVTEAPQRDLGGAALFRGQILVFSR